MYLMKYHRFSILAITIFFSTTLLASPTNAHLSTAQITTFGNQNNLLLLADNEDTYGSADENAPTDTDYSIASDDNVNSNPIISATPYDSDDDNTVASTPPPRHAERNKDPIARDFDYNARVPQNISAPGEKVVVIDPRAHVWAAYDAAGHLVRAGIATAGRDWCPDIGRRCHTKTGIFRVQSLGSPQCRSRTYPLPRGGAPMPYCMFFHQGQALHGAPDHAVGDANLSHGCVRLHNSDAQWLRYNFVTVGTKVIVKPY